MMGDNRTLEMAMKNAERLRTELPNLVQPSNADRDMVILADAIDAAREKQS